MTKRKVYAQRVIAHQPVGRRTPNAVHYKLKVISAVAKKVKDGLDANPNTAYARVAYHEVMTEEELAAKVASRYPGLSVETMKYAVDALLTVIKEELRHGHQVTFSNLFTFGLSFKGRVDPSAPLDARHLQLVPWVRFAPAFINEMNRGIQIAYDEPHNPPKVEVERIRTIASILELTGDFHHYEAVAADLVAEDGTLTPCMISASKDHRLTRPVSKRLFILPQGDVPPLTTMLQLTWIDGGGDHQTLTLDLPPAVD